MNKLEITLSLVKHENPEAYKSITQDKHKMFKLKKYVDKLPKETTIGEIKTLIV